MLLGRDAIILFVSILFISITSSQEDDSNADQMEGLRTPGHKLTDGQVRFIDSELKKNKALQKRVQDLGRDMVECNAKMEQKSSAHENELQQLTSEQRIAVENCEVRLKLAQVEANSANEKINLLQELVQNRQGQIPQAQNDESNNDELANCSKKLEQYRLHNDNLQGRLRDKDNELKDLRLDKQKLLDTVRSKDEQIKTLTDLENSARTEIKTLTDIIRDLQKKAVNNEAMNKLIAENIKLEREKLKLKTDNEGLKSNNLKINNENTDLKGKISNLEALIKKLQNDIREKEEDAASKLNQIIDDLRSKNIDAMDRNDELQDTLNRSNFDYNELLRKIAISIDEKLKLEQEMEALVKEFLNYKKSCYKISQWI